MLAAVNRPNSVWLMIFYSPQIPSLTREEGIYRGLWPALVQWKLPFGQAGMGKQVFGEGRETALVESKESRCSLFVFMRDKRINQGSSILVQRIHHHPTITKGNTCIFEAGWLERGMGQLIRMPVRHWVTSEPRLYTIADLFHAFLALLPRTLHWKVSNSWQMSYRDWIHFRREASLILKF